MMESGPQKGKPSSAETEGIRIISGENVEIGGRKINPGVEIFPLKSGREGHRIIQTNTSIGERIVGDEINKIDLSGTDKTKKEPSSSKDPMNEARKSIKPKDSDYDIDKMTVSSKGVTVTGGTLPKDGGESSAVSEEAAPLAGAKDTRKPMDGADLDRFKKDLERFKEPEKSLSPTDLMGNYLQMRKQTGE